MEALTLVSSKSDTILNSTFNATFAINSVADGKSSNTINPFLADFESNSILAGASNSDGAIR